MGAGLGHRPTDPQPVVDGPRNFGYQRVTDLLRATELFESRDDSTSAVAFRDRRHPSESVTPAKKTQPEKAQPKKSQPKKAQPKKA